MNVKYRIENFAFHDHTGIARHLERMAAKGWLLEKVGGVWKYRAIEPKKVAFTVTYCAHASAFDSQPSAEQQQFIDLCAHTGWVAVKTTGQMQVFYNEDPDAPPLNTEPAVELEGMHRAMKKSFLPVTIVLLLCNAYQLYSFFGQQRGIALLLINSMSMGFAVGALTLLLFYATQLAGYFLYRRRALQAAETGLLLDVPPVHSRLARLWLGLTYVAILLVVADMLLNGAQRERTLILYILVMVAAELTVVYTIIYLLKKLPIAPGVRRILYAVSSFVILFALLTFARAKMPDILSEPQDVPIPFSLTAYDGWDYGAPTVQEGGTFLAEYITVEQSLSQRGGLTYTLTTVRSETLADTMINSLYRGAKNIRINGAISIPNRYDPVDPAPWQADEVYQRVFGDGPIPSYYVRWENVVLQVSYWDTATDDRDIPAALREMLIETFKP